MPYIPLQKRPPLDDLLNGLADYIAKLPPEEQDGALNYSVSKILKKVYPRSYFNYNRSMGVLECIKSEWYRRQIAPYEDEKIAENGDV